MDETSAGRFLQSLVDTLPESLRACLLPMSDQLRRNSRALVFVPVLHVRPGLSDAQRANLLEHFRAQLSTGAYDRNSRQPRARWELRADQRPLNRLLGLAHRLTERLSALDPALSRWKVQPAGVNVEVWLLRPSARPLLVAKLHENRTLLLVHCAGSVVTEDQIRNTWEDVVST